MVRAEVGDGAGGRVLGQGELEGGVALAHAVLCMDRGKVIARGTPAAVLSDPQVREAYLGSEEIVNV